MDLVIFIVPTLATCTAITTGASKLEQFLQPNNVSNYYEFDENTCTRDCSESSGPRICYYRFNLEDYSVLSHACQNCPQNLEHCDDPQCVTADGYQRGIAVVNRMMPGPSIQVCYGDRIIVDVKNMMPARSTTIHWHGLRQEGTPYNDGVPMVTQCPIVEGNSFRYDFYAHQDGSFYWHSHDGIQKVDGLQGSLIIRIAKKKECNSHLYDYDLPAHVIFLQDWYHMCSDQHFPGLVSPDNILYATYYLINGRGRFTDPRTGNTTSTPYSVFRVKRGKRYRFRIIGGTCTHCAVRLSVEGHNLTLISTDGNSVKPIVVDNVILYSGERYDFVLKAVNEVKSYWIKVRGLESCSRNNIYQMAILKYEGSNDLLPQTSIPADEDFNSFGIVLNPTNATCGEGESGVCINQLESAKKFNRKILTPKPDVNFTMTFGYYFPTVKELFQSGTYHRYEYPDPIPEVTFLAFQMNNIYYQPPSSPVLSQREDIQSDAFCPTDRNGYPKCDKKLCSCFHVFRVPLHSVVQFILIDQSIGGGENHPFHLHGNSFNVMAMGYLNNNQIMNASYIADQVARGALNSSRAPAFKDTIAVPSSGFAVVRIVANNPGYWLFHCHFLFHHIVGMALVIQVGDHEDNPPVPRGFPKCGDYLPPFPYKN